MFDVGSEAVNVMFACLRLHFLPQTAPGKVEFDALRDLFLIPEPVIEFNFRIRLFGNAQQERIQEFGQKLDEVGIPLFRGVQVVGYGLVILRAEHDTMLRLQVVREFMDEHRPIRESLVTSPDDYLNRLFAFIGNERATTDARCAHR